MNSKIKIKARVGKELFYSEQSMFGVYSFYPMETSEEIKTHETFGNFTVSGNCPKLTEGKAYEFTVTPTKHKKYGDGYGFVEIEQPSLNTVEEQQEYLRQITTERQADILINAYPNVKIIDYIKQNKIDLNKLKGIKQSKFDKIKENVNMYDNLKVAMVELKGLDITIKAMQRLVNHFGSQENLIARIKENVYSLTEVDLFGFKKVDEYAMKRGDEPTSRFRILACFEHLVKENGKDGHSWIHIDELLEKAEELLKIESKYIVDAIEYIKNNPSKFYFKKEKFTLEKYYNYESDVKYHLDRIMKTYKKKDRNIDFDYIENKLGFTLTDEQKEVIQMSHSNGVMVINGKGGTGKTTVLTGLIESLIDENYISCALSGKAANVLQSKGLNSATIHRMLQVDKNGIFVYNEKNKLPYDIVIIDESSMVNSYLFSCILKAIPDGASVILVGDNGQLAPIGISAVFNDLLDTQYYPNKELTQVHRQAQKSGILSSANLIRDGHKINGRYSYEQQTYGELQDMILFPMKTREEISPLILEIAEGYKNKYPDTWLYEFQIITALKQRGENSVVSLNKKLQEIFNDLNKNYIERGGYQYREGDKIIHSGNNYGVKVYADLDTYLNIVEDELEDEVNPELIHEDDVFNGTLGKIVYLNFAKREAVIEFESIDGLVVYDSEALSKIELGYAITIHRSQGIGVKNVLVTFDYVAYKMLSKQLVYTAFTRASNKLVVICENGALHKAIETDHGSTRNTFLKWMLQQ